MNDLEKLGKEVATVEMKAFQLQVLENIAMYKDGIFEMANWPAKSSGLPYGLWFDDLGKTRTNTHSIPRVKVLMPDGNMISVSIEENPRILLKGTQLVKVERELKGKKKTEMFNYISKHHQIMLQHWYGNIQTLDLFTYLEKEKN